MVTDYAVAQVGSNYGKTNRSPISLDCPFRENIFKQK